VLRDRLLFGPILIALALAGAWADARLDMVQAPWDADRTLPPGVVIAPVVLLLSVMAARELARILREAKIQASTPLTIGAAATGMLLTAFVPGHATGISGAAMVSLAVALVLVGAMVIYGRHRRVEGMIAAAGGALMSFSLFGLMLGFLVTLRREHEVWILLWILLSTKSGDIGAFTVGKLIGRHKLIPWLSPGKTWEGLAGGALFGAAIGAGGAALLNAANIPGAPAALWGTGLGLLFAMLGQAGDLLASVLKRDAGRKDSGHSLPGFGGVIDVIDSLLIVGPAAYWLLPLAS
jgi:phosphatidate cytidylyltransferase